MEVHVIEGERERFPERSKRATPSAPTSAPRTSPTGRRLRMTATAASDGPGSMTRFTSPAINGRLILPVPFRSSRYCSGRCANPLPGWVTRPRGSRT